MANKKNYSLSERKSYKAGFFAGLFAFKKKKRQSKAKKTSGSPYLRATDIPLNYQHNIFMNDENYVNLYKSLGTEYGFGTAKQCNEALRIYKKKYGDKALRDYYGIK